jgi:mannobiose 2-epimerase
MLARRAERMQADLFGKVLPYWRATVDTRYDGYLLADDLKGPGQATSKQLVSQARLIWNFSAAHVAGADGYLEAAEHGYRFLTGRMFDREHGGYAWLTDREGTVLDARKTLYGQAFAIFALVAYHRASRDAEPLERALELFGIVDARAYDEEHGGWFEHFTRDWRPILRRERGLEPEHAGFKNANTCLHWLEALADLYEASGDAHVRQRLEEVLEVDFAFFYPADPARCVPLLRLDWQPALDRRVSHGHVVEAAWLLIRAQEVLGNEPSWDHAHALIDYALQYGFDHQRGGLFSYSLGNRAAFDRTKIWWAQAELMAALSDALAYDSTNAGYAAALLLLLDFIERRLALSPDGIWISAVNARGRPTNTRKAGSWKAGYHEIRAMLKFIAAFGREPSTGDSQP